MTYEEIHPALRECLGYFEAFRRLGFPPDDIYFFLHRGVAYAKLMTQGREFTCSAGLMDCSSEDFMSEWTRVGNAFNAREIPDPDMRRICSECQAFSNSVVFMTSLTVKGIVLPGLGNAAPRKKNIPEGMLASELN